MPPCGFGTLNRMRIFRSEPLVGSYSRTIACSGADTRYYTLKHESTFRAPLGRKFTLLRPESRGETWGRPAKLKAAGLIYENLGRCHRHYHRALLHQLRGAAPPAGPSDLD